MKAAIWQGFDHFCENDPHRVNLFASCISAGPDANVTYQSGMSIGRFPPDICHAVTTVHQAGTPTTGFIDGEVTLDVSGADRKSTRLNSSHVKSSYAVFCLKKKKKHS